MGSMAIKWLVGFSCRRRGRLQPSWGSWRLEAVLGPRCNRTEPNTHETGHYYGSSVRACLAQSLWAQADGMFSVHGPEVRVGARGYLLACILEHMPGFRSEANV